MSEKTVFISYRRDAAGKAFARLLEQALTQRGYDVFLDEPPPGGNRLARDHQLPPWR